MSAIWKYGRQTTVLIVFLLAVMIALIVKSLLHFELGFTALAWPICAWPYGLLMDMSIKRARSEPWRAAGIIVAAVLVAIGHYVLIEDPWDAFLPVRTLTLLFVWPGIVTGVAALCLPRQDRPPKQDG